MTDHYMTDHYRLDWTYEGEQYSATFETMFELNSFRERYGIDSAVVTITSRNSGSNGPGNISVTKWLLGLIAVMLTLGFTGVFGLLPGHIYERLIYMFLLAFAYGIGLAQGRDMERHKR